MYVNTSLGRIVTKKVKNTYKNGKNITKIIFTLCDIQKAELQKMNHGMLQKSRIKNIYVVYI